MDKVIRQNHDIKLPRSMMEPGDPHWPETFPWNIRCCQPSGAQASRRWDGLRQHLKTVCRTMRPSSSSSAMPDRTVIFRRFARERDPARDAMDNSISRCGGGSSRDLDARAVYPFNTTPPYPFLTWARRGGAGHVSPLGLNIHPTYGLWHAYRAALLFPVVLDVPCKAPDLILAKAARPNPVSRPVQCKPLTGPAMMSKGAPGT